MNNRKSIFALVFSIVVVAASTIVLPAGGQATVKQGQTETGRDDSFLVLRQGRTQNRPWDIVLRHSRPLCLELSVAVHHAQVCRNPAPITAVEGFAWIEHKPFVLLGLLSSSVSGRVRITVPTGIRTFSLKRLNQKQRTKLAIRRPLGYLVVPLPGVRCIEQLTVIQGANQILYKTAPHPCSTST